MTRLPVWFERAENLAIGAAVVVAFVHLRFSWWWLPLLFIAFDVSMAGYVLNNRAGAVCYNLVHAYVVPGVLLLSYVLSGSRWAAFLGLLWAFHIVPNTSGSSAPTVTRRPASIEASTRSTGLMSKPVAALRNSRSPLPNPACTCRSAFGQARSPARSRASSAS